MHQVDFEYTDVGAMTLDIDEDLDQDEKELAALTEIKEVYPDVTGLSLTKIKELD
jgi:hypothetical protein